MYGEGTAYFPLLANILDVIGAAMDMKGKASPMVYGVVNLAGRSKKQKARSSKATTLSKSPKEAKMASVADVAGAIGGVAPLTVENFDLDDVEMFANSPLMVPLLSEFFYTR